MRTRKKIGLTDTGRNIRIFRKVSVLGALFVLLLALDAITSNAQGHCPGHSVRWIGQFSSPQDFKKEPGLGEKLLNWILGEERQTLIHPISVFAQDSMHFWVLDQGSYYPLYVDKENGEGRFIKPEDGGSFPSLVGICGKNQESILFTDSRQNKVYEYKFYSKYPTVLNRTVELDQPTGIAFDAETKHVWVVETGAHRVSILNENGELVKRIGTRGTGPGEFNFPTFIWINGSGLVYIVDAMNFRIQIFDTDGKYLSSFGEPGDATGYFASSKGIATDSHGNIYVVDGLFHTVQIFDRKGQFLYNFGTQGRGEGEFWLPSGIYIDRYDRIYIADSYNARVQIFQLVHEGPDEK